jgi:hypothetical protein
MALRRVGIWEDWVGPQRMSAQRAWQDLFRGAPSATARRRATACASSPRPEPSSSRNPLGGAHVASEVLFAPGPDRITLHVVAKVGVVRIWRLGGMALPALLIAGSLIAAGCQGSSTASNKSPSLPTSSQSPSASPPPGGPVPAQLQGDWFYHRATGGSHCHSVVSNTVSRGYRIRVSALQLPEAWS